MMKSNRRERAEAAGVLMGTAFAGCAFAMGVAWLFYAMAVEYVRLAGQLLAHPKF